jgi:hypothetical protein
MNKTHDRLEQMYVRQARTDVRRHHPYVRQIKTDMRQGKTDVRHNVPYVRQRKKDVQGDQTDVRMTIRTSGGKIRTSDTTIPTYGRARRVLEKRQQLQLPHVWWAAGKIKY